MSLVFLIKSFPEHACHPVCFYFIGRMLCMVINLIYDYGSLHLHYRSDKGEYLEQSCHLISFHSTPSRVCLICANIQYFRPWIFKFLNTGSWFSVRCAVEFKFGAFNQNPKRFVLLLSNLFAAFPTTLGLLRTTEKHIMVTLEVFNAKILDYLKTETGEKI